MELDELMKQAALAVELSKKGRLIESEQVLNEICRLSQNNGQALARCGLFLQSQGLFEESISLLSRAVLVSPALPSGHYNLGHAYQNIEKWALSVRCYSNTLKLDPLCTNALINMGICLKNLRQLPEARSVLERALSIDPGSALAWLNLGNICANDDLLRAKKCYEEALKFAPDLAVSHYALGALHVKSGHDASAYKSLSTAIELDPAFVEAYFLLARLAIRRQDQESAISLIRKLTVVAPELLGSMAFVARIAYLGPSILSKIYV